MIWSDYFPYFYKPAWYILLMLNWYFIKKYDHLIYSKVILSLSHFKNLRGDSGYVVNNDIFTKRSSLNASCLTFLLCVKKKKQWSILKFDLINVLIIISSNSLGSYLLYFLWFFLYLTNMSLMIMIYQGLC